MKETWPTFRSPQMCKRIQNSLFLYLIIYICVSVCVFMDWPIEGSPPCLVTRVGKLSHHPSIGFWCCPSLPIIHPQSKSVFTTKIYLTPNASSPAHPAMHLNKKIRSFPSPSFIPKLDLPRDFNDWAGWWWEWTQHTKIPSPQATCTSLS
jgi:hypothetical protein